MSETTNLPEGIETSAKEGDALPTVFIDDVLMSLKYYLDEEQPHIKIISAQVCASCQNQGCLYFCPVGAYRQQADGQIQISYQSCIECGSCRVMCPHANVEWKYPRGGHGIAYKFG
jgi:ferredoxin like protein